MIMNFFGRDHDHCNNKTQCDKKRQNEDVDDNFFPAELRNDTKVCKEILLWKQHLYIRRLALGVVKLVGVWCFHNDNDNGKKFGNP